MFGPAIWLMNRLTYTKKFLLVSGLFLIITTTVGGLLWNKLSADIDFNQGEVDGIEYTLSAQDLMISVLTSEENTTEPQKYFSEISSFNEKLQERFDTKKEYDALKQSFDSYKSNFDPNNEVLFHTLSNDVVKNAKNLVDKIAFKSNLILDPEITTYFLIDSQINQIASVSQQFGLLDLALHHYIDAVESGDQNKINAERHNLSYVFNTAKIRAEFLAANIKTVQAESKDAIALESIPKFDSQSKQLLAYIGGYETLLQRALDNPAIIAQSEDELDTLAAQVQEGCDQLMDGMNSLIPTLLGNRIQSAQFNLLLAFGVTSLLLLANAYLLVGFLLATKKSIGSLGNAANKLMDGDLTTKVHLDCQDELKAVGTAFNDIGQAFANIIKEVKQNAETVAGASTNLSATSQQMKQSAEEVSGLSQSSAKVTEELDSRIRNVAAAVEQSSANIQQVYSASHQVSKNNALVEQAMAEFSQDMSTVASTTEEMSQSVNTVAAAVEEMSASLTEVSKNAARGAQVSREAQHNAENTIVNVDNLGKAADEIGNVIDVIKNIASQTNLLALNATIEAASAGEAGKGFAVVANEVKELAKQSAEATDDIRHRVEQIQQNTNKAIGAIRQITDIITEMNQLNNSIAAAVEEQTATVREISRSVGQTAQAATQVSGRIAENASRTTTVAHQVHEATEGVQLIAGHLEELTMGSNEIAKNASGAAQDASEMSKSIEQVEHSASETNQGAIQVLSTAQDLSKMAKQLEQLVGSFTV